MKKFSKLIISCCMLAFAIAILSFGVFAARNVTFTITNTVSYKLNDVFCQIDGTLSGGAIGKGTTLTDAQKNYTWSNGDNPNKAVTNWAIGAIAFNADNVQPIVVTIKITNLSGEIITGKNTLTLTNNDSRLSFSLQYNVGTQTRTAYTQNATINIPARGYIEFVLTMTLTSEEASFGYESVPAVNFDWQMVINLPSAT